MSWNSRRSGDPESTACESTWDLRIDLSTIRGYGWLFVSFGPTVILVKPGYVLAGGDYDILCQIFSNKFRAAILGDEVTTPII